MDVSNPLRFSVVMPTYNRRHTLERVLLALRAQDYPDRELIVIDDGSSDGTDALVADEFPEVHFLRQANRGPAVARNAGVGAATGDVVAFIDDDCLPPANWLSRLADGYARYPQVAGVGGYIRAPEEMERRHILARFDWHLSQRYYFVGSSEVLAGYGCPAGSTANMSYRKAAIESVGGFDETFRLAAGEDADLKWRICQQGCQLLYVPVGVAHLRDYSWRSFVRQQKQRGVGAARFEWKHDGRWPGPGRILLRFAKRTLLVFPHLVTYREPGFALVEMLAGWLDCWGQWQAGASFREAAHSGEVQA